MKDGAKRISTGLVLAGLAMLPCSHATAALIVDLGSASSFAVLAGASVTSTGPTTLNGNLGVRPGTSVTESPIMTVNGTRHVNDFVANNAEIDLTAAYNAAASRPADATYAAAYDLGGDSPAPGVHQIQNFSSLFSSGGLECEPV